MIIYNIAIGCSLTHDKITELQAVHANMFRGLYALPINLPFTTMGKAMKARRIVLKIVDKRIVDYRKQLSRLTSDEIAALEVNEEGACVGGDSVLHNIMLTSLRSGRKISNTVLRDTCIALLIAGVSTAATNLTVVTYLLARGPSFGPQPSPPAANKPFVIDNSLWQRLVDELNLQPELSATASTQAPEKNRMTLLKACIWEGLRLAPPVTAVRRPLKVEFEVGPYRLPAGVKTALAIVPNKHVDPMRRSVDDR